jgi:hypothetical protein
VDAEAVVLMAARASRLENQDAIDTAIVGTLADPKEVSFDLLFTASFLLAYLLAPIHRNVSEFKFMLCFFF